MIKWVLILTYLATPSPSTQLPSNCAQLPDHFDEEVCIHGAKPQNPSDPEPSQIVLNVYSGDGARKACVDQAVRFADREEELPRDIKLLIGNSIAETYICREELQ